MARQNSRSREGTHFPAFDLGAPTLNFALEQSSGPRAPIFGLLKRLSEAYGPPGSEESVRGLVRDEVKGIVDQVRIDALGNLIAVRRGSGSSRKKILLAANMDEPGFMVTFIDARGYARFGVLGAVKPLTLLGARCQFANGTVGVFGREEKGAAANEILLDKMFIDVGAGSAAAVPIQVGDTACLARELVEVGENYVGKALAGRTGCAVLIETLRAVKKSPHDIACVFTVQSQLGARGAGTAAYSIQPELAVVVEAAPAHDTPGAGPLTFALGNGPGIKLKDKSMISSPSVRQSLLHAARQARVPFQLQVTPQLDGDGTMIQAARDGVPTGALSVPLRYMNSASEMIHSQDLQNAVRILVQLLGKPI
jgi:endoglucanase